MTTACPRPSVFRPDQTAFAALPRFPADSIQTFTRTFKQTNSVASALKAINFRFGFSLPVLDTLLSFHRNRKEQLSEFSAIVIFFNAIAFCIPDSQASKQSFFLLLSGLRFCSNFREYGAIVPYFFRQSLARSIHDLAFLQVSIFGDHQIVAHICDFLLNYSQITEDWYGVFVGFLEIVLNGGVKDCVQHALMTVYQAFLSKARIVRVNDHTRLLRICEGYINALNPTLIRTLAVLSRLANYASINHTFSAVATVFFALVDRESNWSELEVDADEMEVGEVIERRPFKFELFDRNDRYFDDGIGTLPACFDEPEVDLTASCAPSVLQNIGIIEEMLADSSDLMASYFISEISNLIQQQHEPNRFFTHMAVYLRVLQSVSPSALELMSIEHLTPARLFDPAHILFVPGTLHPFISALRDAFVEIVVSRRPSDVPTFVRQTGSSTFLFSELVGRVLSKTSAFSLSCFLESGFLLATVDVSLSLQGIPFSPAVATARSILFRALFRFVELGAADTPVFITSFLRFIFEPEVAPEVIKAFLNSAVDLKSGTAVLLFIRESLIAILVHPDDPRYNNLLFSVVSIITTLAHFPRVTVDLVICFDPLIWVTERFPSRELFCEILKLLDVCPVDLVTDAHIGVLANLIKQRFSDDREIFEKLRSLCLLGRDSCVFRRPRLLLLILAGFGSSAFGETVVTEICRQSLKSFSNLNCCHTCDIDFIFAHFLCVQSAPLFYNGIVFEIAISKRTRKRFVLPLIERLSCLISTSAIAHLLLTYAVRGTLHIADFLLRVASNCAGRSLVFLGPSSRPAQLAGFRAEHFTSDCTLAYTLEIDLAVTTFGSRSVPLLTMSDEEGHCLSIVVCDRRLILVYSAPDCRFTVQLVPCKKVGYRHVVHVFKPEVDTVASYVDFQHENVSQMQPFAFVGKLTVVAGGPDDSLLGPAFGFLTEFAFYTRALTAQEIAAMQADVTFPDAVPIRFVDGGPENRTLKKFLSEPPATELLIGNCDECPLLTLLSMISHFAPNFPSVQFIANLLENRVIDAEVYFCVYRLLDQRSDQDDWFDRLVFNFRLWSRCDPISIERILRHWDTVVVPTHISRLRARSCFLRFLSLYERLDLEAVNRHLYLRLLKKLMIVKFTNDDAAELFRICCSATAPEFAIDCLELLGDMAALIDASVADSYFWSCIEFARRMNRIEILTAVIVAVYKLPGRAIGLMLWEFLRRSFDPGELFASLRNEFQHCPRLIDFFCCLALERGFLVGRDLIALLRVPNVKPAITSSPIWFFIPLLLCLQTDSEEEMVQLLQFLASLSTAMASTVKTITFLLVYLPPLFQNWNTPRLLGLFLTEVRAFATDPDVLQMIETLCVWNLVCHPRSLRNLAITAEFSDGPFSGASQAEETAPDRVSLRTLDEIHFFLLHPPDFAVDPGVLLDRDGSIVQATISIVLNSLHLIVPESQQSRLFSRVLGLDDRECVDAEIEFVRAAFADDFRATIPPLLSEIAGMIEFSVSVDMSVCASNPDQDAITEVVAPPLYQIRRSKAICSGFPVSQSLLSPLRASLPGKFGNCAVQILGRCEGGLIESDEQFLTIYFLRTGKSIRINIDYLSGRIWFRSDIVFEFLTPHNVSYLISMHQPPAPAGLPRPGRDCQWRSNFDWILWLNRSNGRSFNDLSCYPVFPCFVDELALPNHTRRLASAFTEPKLLSDVADLAAELETASHIAPEFYCFPEAITQPLPSWAATAHEFVYEMRKGLESAAVTALLPGWVSAVWGDRLRLPEKCRPVGRGVYAADTAVRNTVIFACFSSDLLWTVDSHGGILGFDVLQDHLRVVRSGQTRQPVGSLNFFADCSGFLIYDCVKREVLRFPSGFSFVQAVDGGLFCALREGFVCCPAACEIARSGRVIVRARRRVVALAVREEFHRAVYGTVAGMVHFVGLNNGREIAEADFGGAIEGVLITQAWGFVVVRGGANIAVYGVNGELLKRGELPSRVVSWSTFVSFDGFDFVAFACITGEVGFFEAFLPDRITIFHRCPDALLVHYDTDAETMMVVRHSGGVEWVPVPILA
jgi:hypothetical protein